VRPLGDLRQRKQVPPAERIANLGPVRVLLDPRCTDQQHGTPHHLGVSAREWTPQ